MVIPSLWLLVSVIAGLFVLVALLQSFTIAKGNQVIVLERRWFGKTMPDGRTVALRDEVGVQPHHGHRVAPAPIEHPRGLHGLTVLGDEPDRAQRGHRPEEELRRHLGRQAGPDPAHGVALGDGAGPAGLAANPSYALRPRWRWSCWSQLSSPCSFPGRRTWSSSSSGSSARLVR